MEGKQDNTTVSPEAGLANTERWSQSRLGDIEDKLVHRIISLWSVTHEERHNTERAYLYITHPLHSSPSLLLPSFLSLFLSLPVPPLVRGERLGTSFAFINITLADRVIFRNQAAGECHL